VSLKAISVSSEEFGEVLICAVRYSLRAQGHMADTVAGFVRSVLGQISGHALQSIERDIAEVCSQGCGNAVKHVWYGLYGDIKTEIRSRKKMQMKLNKERCECILGKTENLCEGICGKCGWNRAVATKRAEHMRRGGLKKCSDGLYRLIMPGEVVP